MQRRVNKSALQSNQLNKNNIVHVYLCVLLCKFLDKPKKGSSVYDMTLQVFF